MWSVNAPAAFFQGVMQRGAELFFVPREIILYYFSNVNALQMRTTMTMPAQSRNLPSLRHAAGQVINLVRRALPQFFQKGVACVGNNSDICNAYHFTKEGDRVADRMKPLAFILSGCLHNLQFRPVWSVNAPTAFFQGGKQRGAELFPFPEINIILFHF